MQLALPPHTAPGPDSLLAPRNPKPAKRAATPVYPDILAAPIFAPDRKPSDGSDAAAFAGGMSVQGVVVSPGFASAIVSGPDGVERVRPGGRVGAWTVVGIDAGHVVLDRAGERRVLAVAKPAAPPTAVAANQDSEDDQ